MLLKLVCLFLSLAETLHNVLHPHHHHSRIVHCCVQWWMWVMWLSPGTKETVYCPASVCLISASVSLYLWRWNIRITTLQLCAQQSHQQPDQTSGHHSTLSHMFRYSSTDNSVYSFSWSLSSVVDQTDAFTYINHGLSFTLLHILQCLW